MTKNIGVGSKDRKNPSFLGMLQDKVQSIDQFATHFTMKLDHD